MLAAYVAWYVPSPLFDTSPCNGRWPTQPHLEALTAARARPFHPVAGTYHKGDGLVRPGEGQRLALGGALGRERGVRVDPAALAVKCWVHRVERLNACGRHVSERHDSLAPGAIGERERIVRVRLAFHHIRHHFTQPDEVERPVVAPRQLREDGA